MVNFVIGVFVGAMVGFLFAALCVASGRREKDNKDG